MAQVEVQKLQLQINTDWEATIMANQVEVKMYDRLIEEGLLELGEVLEKAKAKFKRWHFEQTKNYVSDLDVAYQRITPNEETKDDAIIEGEAKRVEEEGKSIEVIEKGKQILAYANIMDISNEDEITPLSHLYSHSAIKEKLGNAKIGINWV